MGFYQCDLRTPWSRATERYFRVADSRQQRPEIRKVSGTMSLSTNTVHRIRDHHKQQILQDAAGGMPAAQKPVKIFVMLQPVYLKSSPRNIGCEKSTAEEYDAIFSSVCRRPSESALVSGIKQTCEAHPREIYEANHVNSL